MVSIVYILYNNTGLRPWYCHSIYTNVVVSRSTHIVVLDNRLRFYKLKRTGNTVSDLSIVFDTKSTFYSWHIEPSFFKALTILGFVKRVYAQYKSMDNNMRMFLFQVHSNQIRIIIICNG